MYCHESVAYWVNFWLILLLQQLHDVFLTLPTLSCNSHGWWVTLHRTVLLCYSKESFLIHSEDFFSHCNFLSGFVVDVSLIYSNQLQLKLPWVVSMLFLIFLYFFLYLISLSRVNLFLFNFSLILHLEPIPFPLYFCKGDSLKYQMNGKVSSLFTTSGVLMRS